MIIDGKEISENILENLKREIEEKQLKLKLAVVLVGDDFASKIYVKRKGEACQKIGIKFELFNFPSNIPESELENEIKKISSMPDVSGVIVQLPLPKGFNAEEILKTIPKEKDVESVSPVIRAIEYILKEYNISLENKKIALIGRGKLVGGPLAEWLENQNLEVVDIDGIKEADVVISGVGKPRLINGDMVKQGAVVIDIGFSHDEHGKAVGDVDFESVSPKAGLITPVPGGVGPMTVACLLENLVHG